MASPQEVFVSERKIQKKIKRLLFQNDLPQILGIWYVAVPDDHLPGLLNEKMAHPQVNTSVCPIYSMQ